MKYLAVPFNEYSAYLVHAEHDQSDNDIIITQEQYEYLLDVNNNKQAEIRVIELEDGSLAVKDFYGKIPSRFHVWNRKTQQFEISEEDFNKFKSDQNIAFLSSETRRTNDAIEIIDDAIEFDMATDEEVAQHKELRKYRLLLSRVSSQADYPLNPAWPECPEFFKQ